MSDYKAVAVLQPVNGQPKDVVTNSFHFSADDDVLAVAAASAVIDFYNLQPIAGVGNGSSAPGRYISEEISRALLASALKVYKLPASPGPVGSPIGIIPWTLVAAGGLTSPNLSSAGANLPGEVACCLSMNADLTGLVEVGPVTSGLPSTESAIDQGAPATHSGKTRPKAHRRGRVYIGPFQTNCLATQGPATTVQRPSAFLIQDLLDSANHNLGAGIIVRGGTALRVFSVRDWVGHDVTNFTVDDAFDTQRRRGTAPTSKFTEARA